MCKRPEIVQRSGSPEDEVGLGSYWCENCERWAYVCPLCKVLRCSNDLIMTMVGSWPLACKMCRPDGVKQSFLMGIGGPYVAGNQLIVDDPDIEGFVMK